MLKSCHPIAAYNLKSHHYLVYIIASDESPYGLTEEDVSNILGAEIIIAADGELKMSFVKMRGYVT